MLNDYLRKLSPSGPDGFEGLIAKLLSSLTDRRFSLAKSGAQAGRDISSRDAQSNVLAVECKRYLANTSLNDRELLGEMAQAKIAIPDLDIWVLVTTRDIPSQTTEELQRNAVLLGIDYFAISAGDGEPSSLEMLCANSPDVVFSLLHSRIESEAENQIRSRLTDLSTDPSCDARIANLKDQLLKANIGYDNWRCELQSLYQESLKSESISRSYYAQPLNISDSSIQFIDRPAAWDSLDTWYKDWKNTRNMFVMKGEEGDGKTWSVASWLSRKLGESNEFPPVLFISSQKMQSEDPLDQLSNYTSRLMRSIRNTDWSTRLFRWLEPELDRQPRLVLVLDGINERLGAAWWKSFMNNITGNPLCSSIAIILTSRTLFWDRHIGPLRHIGHTSYDLAPFDDNELSLALKHNNLALSDIPSNILHLIRRPRYFSLMLKHRERISQSGDVTAARLIYEDWRDRLERKDHLGDLDDETFQDILKDLALQYEEGIKSIKSRQMDQLLPSHIEKGPIIDEFIAGGIIDSDNRVDKQQLAYGLGLILVDQVKSTSENNDPDFGETIARWLEPQAEMDIKASICEYAVLYSLNSPQLPPPAQAALLLAWINCHNPGSRIEDDFVAYMPHNPKSYFDLAEIIWSNTQDNPWAANLVMKGLLRWSKTPSVADHFPIIFERWFGFVHIYGIHYLRGFEGEKADKVRAEIDEKLGFEIQIGPFEFADRHFTAIDDDGLLRLSRVALNVISHLPRAPYLKGLATGCLAEEIMGEPSKYDIFKWIMMTSEDSLWNGVEDEVNKLLTDSDITTQRTAHRLLSFEGSAEALKTQSGLPEDLFPQNLFIKQHLEDPCRSWYPWQQDNLKPCLERNDLEAHIIARKLAPLCIDPNTELPVDISPKLIALIDTIPVEKISLSLVQSVEDHNLSEYEPVFYRYIPERLSEFHKTLGAQTISRSKMPLRQLAIHLQKSSIILSENEFHAIKDAWTNLCAQSDTWDHEDEFTEAYLFNLLLHHFPADEQLLHLLKRPDNAHDLVRLSPAFSLISDWSLAADHLDQENDVNILRTLWFLSYNSEQIPEEFISTKVLKLLDHSDTMVRAYVLKIVYLSKHQQGIKTILGSNWAWNGSINDKENYYGSLLISEHGSSMPYTELHTRIHPLYIGYAVNARGAANEEIEQYAEDIDKIWQSLYLRSPDVPPDLPMTQIDIDYSEPLAPNFFSLDDSLFSKSVTFLSRNSVWGGVFNDDAPNLKNFFGQDHDDDRTDRLIKIVQETIKEQNEAGNLWFSRHFSTTALKEVLTRRPDYMQKWIDAILTEDLSGQDILSKGRSFYEALCFVLLEITPDIGKQLYLKLKNESRLRFIDRRSGIPTLKFVLFKNSGSSAFETLANQEIAMCTNDRELLEIAIMAQSLDAQDWLNSYIQDSLPALAPFPRVRSIILLGFIDTEEAYTQLKQMESDAPESWEKDIIKLAIDNWQKNSWAKHWYRSSLLDEDEILAWRSFRLFLRCVTSMFWVWDEQIANETKDIPVQRKRLLFATDNIGTIRHDIEKNEKDMREKFIGQKVHKGQVWLWMK